MKTRKNSGEFQTMQHDSSKPLEEAKQTLEEVDWDRMLEREGGEGRE